MQQLSPTLESEREFLAQCDYVNRLETGLARQARRLLRERSWEETWSEMDEDVIWNKLFFDGDHQHLSLWDAFEYEQDRCRAMFKLMKQSVCPRVKRLPPVNPQC
jgi:hypothetical protein